MAAGALTFLNIAKAKLIDGTVDANSHTFKLALCDASQALSASFVGASTDGRYSDLTGEFTTGGGYTAGGQTLTTVTLTLSAGVVYWDADDVTWAAITKTGVKYGVLYDDTAANKPILAFFELNAGGTISPVGNDLSIIWPSTPTPGFATLT